jgi:hypothetical protein
METESVFTELLMVMITEYVTVHSLEGEELPVLKRVNEETFTYSWGGITMKVQVREL